MRRQRLVVIAATLGLIPAVAACGSSGSVADSDIVSALNLEKGPDGPAYSLGGDPFCVVSDDLLNDSDEVEVARDSRESELVITDSDESVGVQAVPPFDPICARKAKRELDQLE